MAVQQHVLNWLYSVLTSEYQDVNRTYNDVSQALSHFPSLSPRTDVHTFPNGASALLLHLSGTLPAVFRGATYRYPISLWVPHNYPREAPLVYVTPTEHMMVRPGQHVDPQGQVYHPYLAGWPEFWDKSSIVDFLTILREVFAKEPPVIARQTPRPPPPPPQPQQAPQELATPTHQIPQPAPPGSVAAASTPTPSPQPPPPPPKGDPRAGIPPVHNTPSPPPIPPHPSYVSSGTTYSNPAAAAAATGPSPPPPPPPPPPHPSASASAAAGGVRSSWYGVSPPPPQAVEAGPSSRNSEYKAQPGVPPVPGRPPYQQSPLGQPPMSPSQQHAQLQHPQHQIPPFSPQPPSSISPPPPSQFPPGFASAQQFQYSQQQPSQGYPQQRSPPPPWPQQQPPPPQFQQYQQQQQQQQQQYGQYLPQQHQPRLRQPPPDIMDEPLSDGAAGNGGASATSDAAARGRRATDDDAAQPPPVPPNPEKDALLHRLAHTLAVMRHESRSKNESTLAGLQAQRAAMVTAENRLQQEMSGVEQLSALLTSNTDILHESMAAADGVVANSQQTRPPEIDELLVGPTVVANQLYELVAEERALADAVFMLGRAVERGRVAPVVFAKMTRSLAREWYLKKALVRKVGRGMGLAQA